MAKFDIETPEAWIDADDGSGLLSVVRKGAFHRLANYEPNPLAGRLHTNSIRIRAGSNPLGTIVRSIARGIHSHGALSPLIIALVMTVSRAAAADPTTATIPDPVPRERAPTVGPGTFRPSWDLDGLYLWLGPTGAASHIDGAWDSTIGGHATMVRVRERAALGVVGAMVGATLWTERGGGRIWLDGLVGTRLGRMVGLSAGPLVELGPLAHPRMGASVGLWGFVGVAPYVRVGVVDQLGGFAEIGLHVALPVLRR